MFEYTKSITFKKSDHSKPNQCSKTYQQNVCNSNVTFEQVDFQTSSNI